MNMRPRTSRLSRGLAAGVCLGVATAALAQSPVESFTPEQIAAGAKLYADNCAVCHGPKMVDQGGGFFDLRSFPPNQRNRFVHAVSNGKNSMPPWRSLLTQEQIGFLFAYVIAGEKK